MRSEFKKKQPYFMKNKTWYYYDAKEKIFKLTDKAPKEAIDNYNEIFSTKNNEFIEDYYSEYKAYINEEIMKLSNDKESMEIFNIN